MRHDEPQPMQKSEAQAAFASQDREQRALALLACALHEPDWRWVQAWCLRFTEDPDVVLRGLAVTCLGHLARIHRELDLELVMPVLERLRADPQLSGRVEDALDDISTFVGVGKTPPARGKS